MAPINKKIRAIIRDQNMKAANSTTTINSTTSTPTIVTTTAPNTSNATTVITTASSSPSSSSASSSSGSSSSVIQGGQTSDSNNAASSDSEQAEGTSSNPATPQSDESSVNVVMGEDCPNLSFVGQPKRSSTSILTPISVSSQFGKLLRYSSQRNENCYNVNINHQYVVPSPASSPFDTHSQPFSYSASSSSSSLSTSPSTSNQGKFARSSDSPSSVYLYENATRRQSVISSSDRSSPSTSNKETNNESPVEEHRAFNLHAPYKQTSKSSDGNSSSGQSGKITIDKSSEEYRMRRERNNIAVRKSRSKSKIKFQQTIERMNQLETENARLHHHISKMNQELSVLKFLLEKYQDENYKRIMKLDNVDSMEIQPEIRMVDRVEFGNERFQIRNFGNSRSNINPFFSER